MGSKTTPLAAEELNGWREDLMEGREAAYAGDAPGYTEHRTEQVLRATPTHGPT